MSDDTPRAPVAVDATVGGVLAAIGAAAGGPLGAGLAQAATPYVSAAVQRTLTELSVQSACRSSRTLTLAAASVEVDDVTLVEALLNDRTKAVLLGRAIEGAARSAAEEKISWFAGCIAAGYLAEDDAVVDKELFYVEAFAQLEVPHIRVLMFLANDGDVSGPWPPTTDDVSDAFATTLCPMIRPVLSTLESVGLVVKRVAAPTVHARREQKETGVPHVWEVTAFGKRLLARIGAGGTTPEAATCPKPHLKQRDSPYWNRSKEA